MTWVSLETKELLLPLPSLLAFSWKFWLKDGGFPNPPALFGVFEFGDLEPLGCVGGFGVVKEPCLFCRL